MGGRPYHRVVHDAKVRVAKDAAFDGEDTELTRVLYDVVQGSWETTDTRHW